MSLSLEGRVVRLGLGVQGEVTELMGGVKSPSLGDALVGAEHDDWAPAGPEGECVQSLVERPDGDHHRAVCFKKPQDMCDRTRFNAPPASHELRSRLDRHVRRVRTQSESGHIDSRKLRVAVKKLRHLAEQQRKAARTVSFAFGRAPQRAKEGRRLVVEFERTVEEAGQKPQGNDETLEDLVARCVGA